MKIHQTRSEACRASIEAASPPPPLPADRVIRRIRKSYASRKPRPQSSPISASDQSSMDPPSPTSPPSPPQRRPRRRTTRPVRANSEEGQPSGTPNNEAIPPTPTPSYADVLRSSPASTIPTPSRHDIAAPLPARPPTDTREVPQPLTGVSQVGPLPISSPPGPPAATQEIRNRSTTSNSQQADTPPPSWVSAWITRFDAAIDEDILEGVLGDFIALAQQICEIQRLYRANRKRAFDRVVGGPSRFCRIDAKSIEDHYREMYKATTPANTDPVPARPCTPPDTNNPFEAPFTPQEVARRISKGHNTAPGPDGLRYLHWRRVDPKGLITAAIFNAVRRIGYVPSSWKISTTVLIHKKGEVSNISNWRPICLSNTLGKLYTACLADRLLRWCNTNNRLSSSQKGFLNYQGCIEHNFVLQSVIQNARRCRKDCFIAWLDIANAFGNIPHVTLWESLKWHGLHQDAICVLQQLYDGSSTQVRTSMGLTESIPMQSGVKQGCPISPLLFILAVEPAIRRIADLDKGYSLNGYPTSVLAYADDIALISDTAEGLQLQLDAIADWTKWANINFNIAKCGTLSIRGKEHTTSNNSFLINQQTIPVLGNDDAYRHLGVPTGFGKHDTPAATINGILQSLVKLHTSKLAPWQKVDALNTFIMPKLTFCLTAGTTPKSALTKIDRATKRYVKKWLGLPQRASPEIVHLPYMCGGTNVTPTNQLADIAQVSHAMHLFFSKDSNITGIALKALTEVINKRIGKTPNDEDLCEYLNGSMDGDFGLPSADITSLWTRLRMATRRLKKRINIAWTVGPGNLPNISAGTTLIRPEDCQRVLCGLLKEHFLGKLLAKPDQGKAYKVTSFSPVSNHFMNNGKYTRFSDWYFIHRARMSVVALRGHRRFGNDTKRCRRCGYARETLAHVLCHCPPNLHLVTQRHNAILDRIVAAFKPEGATVLVNQRVPGFSDICRPDMVIIDEKSKSATIIDVTTPFENGQTAFQLAREEKLRKYAPFAQHFRQQGFDTHISAFIVGALGGYDHANEATLQRLGISRHYAKLMKKLMVSDSIKWSNDIYRGHIGDTRQRRTTSLLPSDN
ncbi:uncharacterized protein LOC111613450 [Centruroides sculpturatus]|uniref:uncharacterized protein LOC111613450 n=1 Tax=Centruroides sculpturatus TaxID=218467 RepID=UPI000C6CC138|nr:uncharacterized protein LOC111613450 [Centruroides sculpturatus]